MRKMKKYRFSGLACFLFLCIVNKAKAQGIFEDADKLSDLMSGNSAQHFDLRHTIPGIPEVDYPIYSHVPKTSFECTGRHEGYYADVESRCQAFRICTHTARSVHGFGFLCPNGTLFNQKHFVCDWYRNVNCDDSESFFSKNDINRIGSSFDMMETVRQMMEYPMKTITKALQQTPSSNRKPAQRHRGANRGTQTSSEVSKETDAVRGRGRTGSTRKSVTRDQVESAHNRGTTKFGREKETSTSTNTANKETTENHENVAAVTKSENSNVQVEKSASSDVTDDEVYVNSLGELSTDPGVTFDRTNAHIIAEPRPYRYEKKLNFAEKVNAGLNDFIDLPSNESLAPDYIKSLRETSNETSKTDLPSNINGLLDEIVNDLNPSISGYQVKKPAKAKHSFRFLSRGFSSQDDPYKYTKPKQTASTIRFTPNQLPNDEEKTPTKHVLEIALDAVPFGHSTVPPETTAQPPSLGDALDYLLPPPELPDFDEAPFLSPPVLEPIGTGITSVPTEEPTIGTTVTPSTAEPEQEPYTVTPADIPTFAPLIDTTTPTAKTEASNVETPTVVPDIAQNIITSSPQDQLQKLNADETPVDEERVDVNKQAENLFISGLQLTNNEKNTELDTSGDGPARTPLLIQVADDHSYLTAWVTSTPTPVTESVLTTTTEAQPEQGSLQERIRNYRRLANLRATAKPLIYSKRAGIRMTKLTSTSTTTTPKSTSSTRSYLKRIAASRLRLSRLAAAAANKQHQSNQAALTAPPVLSPVDNAIDSSSTKKLTVRNIDKETGNAANSLNDSGDAKNSGAITWESVKNSLQRFQVNRKPGHDSNSNAETTLSPNTASSTTTRNSLLRKRNRVSNYKPQLNRVIESGSNDYETTKEPATSTSTSVSTSKSMSVSSSSSSSFSKPSSLSFMNTIPLVSPTATPPQQTLSLTNNNQVQNDIATSTIPSNSFINRDSADNTNLNSNSASGSDNFISFDKLTRSILDDSILQNYRGGQILGRSSLASSAVDNFKSSSPSTSRNAFGQFSSSSARSSFTHNTPVAYTKLPEKAPSQLIPPQHPAQLPTFPAKHVLTTPGPRIVVARAEGQRIEPNDVSSIISSLITQQQKTQPKTTPSSSYVPLNDFLTKKFGNQVTNKISIAPTSNYVAPTRQYQQQYNQPQQYKQTGAQQQQHFSQNQPQQQQEFRQQQKQDFRQQQQEFIQQQQQEFRQQPQQQFPLASPVSSQHYQQKPQQFYQTQQKPQYQANRQQQQQQFAPLAQQQQQNNYYQSAGSALTPQTSPPNNYFQQNQPQTLFNQQAVAIQTPSVTPSLQPQFTENIFATFKQQQQQLPPFPPLATPSQQSAQLLQQFDGNNNYLNVQLPALPNGLIPAPTNQIAQKRSDFAIDGLELTDFTPVNSIFNGATSYDVPLSSIGRLPNDMQALYRRSRKY